MSDTKDLHIERFLPARPGRTWMAWTEPDLIAKWWSPYPEGTAEVPEWEVAAGGTGKAIAKDPQDSQAEPLVFELAFKKVVPSREITFTVNEKNAPPGIPEMRVSFEPEEGGEETKMIFDSPRIPADRYEDAAAGWQAFFDKLEDALTDDSGDLLFEGGEGMRIGDPNSDE